MKIDQAALKEIKHIGLGILVMDTLVIAVHIGLKILDLRTSVFLLGGSLVMFLNFVWLCYSVQKTLEAGENAKGVMTRSYVERSILLVVWSALVFLLNKGNYKVMIAGVIPYIMPNLTIKFINLLKYLKKGKE